MELTYDWKNFQNFFHLKKKFSNIENPEPIFMVVEGRVVVSVYSEGGDFSDWVGATYDEMVAQFSNRELILFERKQVDECLSKSIHLMHFYDQMHFFQREAKPRILSKTNYKLAEAMSRNHFLLRALDSWWGRFFPSTYGIYIHLQGGDSLLIIIQRGRLDSFHVPDLSSMMKERRDQPLDRVKFLMERHLIPIQGLFLTLDEWTEWSELAHPWRKIASTLKTNRGKLVPFNWGLASLIFGKGYCGI